MADLSGIDLLNVIGGDTTLKQTAKTSGGEYSGPCPFCGGTDRFNVWPNHPQGRGRWWCRRCDLQGDAIDYIRERRGLGYREALDLLGLERVRQAATSHKPAQPGPSVRLDAPCPTWDAAAALAVVADCEAALWTDSGAKARAWLHERGLHDDTLRAWRLGYNATDREIHSLWTPRGIVIPCLVDGLLWYIKVRRPSPPLPGPKYQKVKGSKAALYGLDFLTAKRVVVICEGELDALLLWQEVADLVDVVALGSKSARPAIPLLSRLAGAVRWLVALDVDADKEADWWGDFSARVRRVRPLRGNDLTDFHQAGGDLRSWAIYHIERLGLADRPLTHGLEHDAAALFADLDGDPAGVAWAIRWARLHDAHDVKCHGYPTWAAWAVAVRHAALAGRLDAVGAGSRRNDSRLAVLAGAVGDEVATQGTLML